MIFFICLYAKTGGIQYGHPICVIEQQQ